MAGTAYLNGLEMRLREDQADMWVASRYGADELEHGWPTTLPGVSETPSEAGCVRWVGGGDGAVDPRCHCLVSQAGRAII